MQKNWAGSFLVAILLAFLYQPGSLAQEPSSQQPASDSQKEKTSPEEKAVGLLEQIGSDAQSLKLPENRIHIQIVAADMLWDRDEGRARALFAAAASGITEI